MDAFQRLQELPIEQPGNELAKILHDEGYTIEETRNAFFKHGYTAVIANCTLHVSNFPEDAGMPKLVGTMLNPHELPSVTWFCKR